MSKVIKKILDGKDSASVSERVRLVREWLQSEYRVKDVKDKNFLELLSVVHDHDNLPLHFGEVQVGTSFESLFVRIFEVNEGWHLGTSRKSGEEFTIIHPGYEQAGVTPENLKALNTLKSLVKRGKVIVPDQGNVQLPVAAPVAVPGLQVPDGSVVTVSGFEEDTVEEGALKETPVVSTTFIPPSSTTSFTINMDDYLK